MRESGFSFDFGSLVNVIIVTYTYIEQNAPKVQEYEKMRKMLEDDVDTSIEWGARGSLKARLLYPHYTIRGGKQTARGGANTISS